MQQKQLLRWAWKKQTQSSETSFILESYYLFFGFNFCNLKPRCRELEKDYFIIFYECFVLRVFRKIIQHQVGYIYMSRLVWSDTTVLKIKDMFIMK